MTRADDAVRPLRDREFRLFQGLIRREAGIWLSDAKKPLVEARLNRRVREIGLTDYGAYFERVEASNDERAQMLDNISTNETRFFREPKQFAFLDQEVFPKWRELGESRARPKRVRVWSAGCSTGEEPYSIAMLMASHFPASEGWVSEIVASDLSNRVLAIAREGVWPIERAADIPIEYRKAYMLRGTRSEEGRMRVHPILRTMIDFRRINLYDTHYGLQGPFDLVFCRNVMIYFDRDSKDAVVERLMQLLSAAGYLLLGHAESLTGSTHDLQNEIPTVYRIRSRQSPALTAGSGR
jgi:chemotaxis protein methyltransferase CheR